MILKELKPRHALNKAFLKLKPGRIDMNRFKTNLLTLLDRINNTESEEFHKNIVSDFLKDTYYKQNHFINTKGRNDLVVHNSPVASSSVGVIIEAKKPTNKAEMLRNNRLNSKAFQELVLYYLRERITHKNLEIKHLMATNINEWFVFDAHLFDRLFAQNKSLVKQFTDFEDGRLADNKTDFFYKQIAEPFINKIAEEIEFVYFNLQDYAAQLRADENENDALLIPLYKIFSPEHLLKLPFANDSNSLDRGFYGELLHILGLNEVQDGAKKLIERKKAQDRHSGSILENTILELDSLDKLSRLKRPSQYGSNTEEQLFTIGLELSITWINRILFLKLLEAQLVSYHKGDKSYFFLNLNKLPDYNALNSLFFQVLAREHENRNKDVKEAYQKVPYLNSSLFEPTEMEQVTLFISNLKDDKTIPIFPHTVLKDQHGKKQTGTLSTLTYLLAFLDAYDFGTEGNEEIQEDNKTLINASVLGLIFEKINGYKDGSFFTPGFITMYMCRETIRKALVQKFNETKKWNCTSIEELCAKIEDRLEANQIVNSLRVCDPAVGSGHFLVSALNEIIAIKNDLGILLDFEGKRPLNCTVQVVNDELFITEKESAEEFYYLAPAPRTEKSIRHTFGENLSVYKANQLPERQVIQQSIFKEKQVIIESCLFGVDINPNSVKICRLRLWIELLKNAYYTVESNFSTLETLPNIDINIKCGNSLVSRFALDSDLKRALKKNQWTVEGYRRAVATYRNAENREQKREMMRLMADIKADCHTEISKNDPKLVRKRKLEGELRVFHTQISAFELSAKQKKEQDKKVEWLAAEIEQLEATIQDQETNQIYDNAFEWRFEFPEVLNENGDFMGFDVVIGNPPYISNRMIAAELKTILETSFRTAVYQYDLYSLFIEKSTTLTKKNGLNSLIIPDSFLARSNFKNIREYLYKVTNLYKILHIDNIFDEANVSSCVYFLENSLSMQTQQIECTKTKNMDTFVTGELTTKHIQYLTDEKTNSFRLLFIDDKELSLLVKLFQNTSLQDHVYIWRGEEIGKKSNLIIDKQNNKNTFPIITGENIERYAFKGEIKHIVQKSVLKEMTHYSKDKLVIRQLGARINASVAEGKVVSTQSVYCLYSTNKDYSNILILAILNSKLIHFIYERVFAEKQQFPRILIENIKSLTLPQLHLAIFAQIEHAVNKILSLKKESPTTDTTALEAQIDHLVYQLYGLTDEEMAIVEKA